MPDAIPDLDGKIVYLYVSPLSKGWDDGITLEAPELRTIAGRTFLVGNTVDHVQPEWGAGPPTSVAWDAVTAFMTYPSREAFVAAVERAAPEGSPRPTGLFNRIFGKG